MEWLVIGLKWAGIAIAGCVAVTIIGACCIAVWEWADNENSKAAEIAHVILQLPSMAIGAMLWTGTLVLFLLAGLIFEGMRIVRRMA